MAVDWRALFDEIKVEWVDRGPNTSRRNINIQCPWCGTDDPSHHLAVAQDDDAYYCYRRPSEHSGRSAIRLLVALGLSRADAMQWYNSFTTRGKPPPVELPPEVAKVRDRWNTFPCIDQCDPLLDYLADRGFRNVVHVAQRYDLRFEPRGKFAARVLFPLSDGEQTTSWTGRAIRSNMQPRYLMQSVDCDGLIYLPRTMRSVGVVVEGPVDALKIAAATESDDISALGLVGLNANDDRLTAIRKACANVRALLFATDNNVNAKQTSQLITRLQRVMRRIGVPVRRIGVPEAHKDAGEMSYEEIRQWLSAHR